jgi:two-component system cell cycle response regulator
MSAKVLVIDDLEANLKMFEGKLAENYYDITIAKSGEEALKILETHEIDVILLDSVMPIMDGFETCKKIKSNDKYSIIPIIMLSTAWNEEERLKGLAAGADDFIPKNASKALLFAKINSLANIKKFTYDLIEKNSNSGEILELDHSAFSQELSNSKIFIIDDNLVQIENLKHIICKITNNISIARKFPFDPTSEIRENDVDIIIINSEIANNEALKICSKIINKAKFAKIPIVILIEENDENTIIKALEIMVADCIKTPFKEEEVKIRIINQLKRKKLQDKLESNFEKNISLASRDALTDIYNRHYFDSHAKILYNNAISEKSSLSFIIIDLDHFKLVNDTYGHQVGDEVLKQTSSAIKSTIRPGDLLARFGGEEFVILLPDTNLKNAEIVAERIRKKIEETDFTISHAEKIIHKTTSIGLTELQDNEDSIEKMIARADKALYLAKDKGRNIVIIVT